MARNGLAHDEPYLWDNRYLVKDGELLHRKVFRVFKGGIPKGMVIHHINGDRLDNRPENLKMVTRAEHCKIHKPRLGTRSPVVKVCRVCGSPRSEKEIKSEPHRHKCNHCRAKANAERKKRNNVSYI